MQDKKELKQFIHLAKLFKEWFEFEEIDVMDTVCGRMAIRVRDLLKEERQELKKKVEGKKKKCIVINKHGYEEDLTEELGVGSIGKGYNQALSDILTLLEE